MLRKLLSPCLAAGLSLCLLLTTTAAASAQGPPYRVVGARMNSVVVPDHPAVTLPSDLPTYMTSINYPLVHGAYAIWPYAAPVSFTGGGSLPAGPPDLSMRPTPVVTKAYAPSLSAPAVSALISVALPASAELYFQGMRVPQAGTLRRFSSPELDPLMSYTYDVRAVWLQDGQWVSQSQRLLVRAGDHLTITFPQSQPSLVSPTVPLPRPSPEPVSPGTLQERPTPRP
ncbi:hypothetical protein AYO40_06470 [Planctomycetaceae bacterium SCGC AG-212-D15]|nr:hypothetical protein AYO40_06470 [Planctomycetaceae bacterium SCGC AG-212-D15]